MLGRIHNVPISEADVAELSKGLASLPPHPDFPESLRKLKAPGYRLVTLTGLAGHPRSRAFAGGRVGGPFRTAVRSIMRVILLNV